MARISRKKDIAELSGPIIERVYNTALYVRLSVDQENNESIEMQQYMLERYAREQRDMSVVGIFCDNGATGTDFDRPEFERMMDEVRNRNIDCIVVKDLSRFGRNYVETGYYLEKIFPFLGVRFVAINDNYDSIKDEGSDQLIVSLKNIVNSIYAKDISKKTSAIIALKQKSGNFMGASAPYGYRKILAKNPNEKHRLVIDNEAARVVRDIFAWKAQGVGNNQIARRLNEKAIPSPSMYQYINGQYTNRIPSALWQAQIISKITQNAVYIGTLAQGKTRKSLFDGMPTTRIDKANWVIIKETHEAIIDETLFEQVQELREARANQIAVNFGKYPSTENVLRGLVFCNDCGTKMIRYKNVSKKGTVRYSYLCRVYEENLDGCTKKSLPEAELMNIIMSSLRVQVALTVEFEEMIERITAAPDYQDEQKKLEDELQKSQQAIIKNTTLRSTLFESYNDKMLTKEEYADLKRTYDGVARKLTVEHNRLLLKKKRQRTVLSPLNAWIQAFHKYGDRTALTREMAVELINRIVITGYNEVELVWNFRDEYQILAQYNQQQIN